MPPARGDHEARRRDVSEAVWRVLAARGFAGLTLRAVAAEMGATTGLLTHYFPSKQALVAHALEVLDERSDARPRPAADSAAPAGGLAMVRALLLDVLPLTERDATDNRIWVGSWDAALAAPGLAAEHAERYRRSRRRLLDHVTEAQRAGELPGGRAAEDMAAAAQCFVLGLVVQALFAPEEFPPERQTALVDGFLAGLGAA